MIKNKKIETWKFEETLPSSLYHLTSKNSSLYHLTSKNSSLYHLTSKHSSIFPLTSSIFRSGKVDGSKNLDLGTWNLELTGWPMITQTSSVRLQNSDICTRKK